MENKSRKTDRRTLYTKMVIKEAYCTLLHNKEYDRITVTDICKLAEINRTTFYLHYIDSKAVFEELLDEVLEDLINHFDGDIFQGERFWERNEAIYQGIIKDSRISFLLKKGIAYQPFVEKFATRFAKICLPYCKTNSPLPEKDLQLLLTGLMYSYVALDIFCLKTHTIKELEHCNALFNRYLFEPCYKSILFDFNTHTTGKQCNLT